MKHEAIKAAWAARNKLYIEGDKRREEGDKVYRDAVVEKYGNDAGINWETGEITIGEALIIMGEGE